jgi:DNA recombination protein RmuC
LPVDSTHLVWLGLGLLSGAAVAWGALSGRARAARRGALLEGLARAAALEARLAEREAGLSQLREALLRRDQELRGALGEARAQGELRAGLEASLAEERRSAAAQAALLDLAQERLSDAFKALSAETLAAQGRQFLELAQGSLERFQDGARTDLSQRQQAIAELVAPVRETVVRLGDSLQRLEVARTDAYRALHEQVRFLSEGQGLLRAEAGKLVQALRAPAVRGRWGEIQLRRVVELAGMQAHCDFVEQAGIAGGRLRPDLVVRLPGGKVVAVDAKVPLSATTSCCQPLATAFKSAMRVVGVASTTPAAAAFSSSSGSCSSAAAKELSPGMKSTTNSGVWPRCSW